MNACQVLAASLSRRAVLRSTAMLGAGAALSAAPFSSPAMALANGGWPRVRRMVDSYVEDGKVANMVAGLGFAQASPTFIAAGNTSFTSGLMAGPDSLYRIYSMTKPVTAMAVMMCIEDGLLTLDQPIAEIIPAFANMQVQKEYDGAITADNLEPAVRPITVRHCLTHTSGLGYSIVQQGPIAAYYNANGLVPGQVTRLPLPDGIFSGRPAPSLEAFAHQLAAAPLVYQPGTHWSYSVGLDLLGRVIEVVTGKAFDTFLQERIFTPCDMTSTFFRVPESEKARLSANYFVLEGELLPIDLPDSSIFLDKPAFPFGGAGLVSSSSDYDRFLMMLAGYGAIDGVRVMSEASVRLATSNLLPDTLAPDGGFSFGERKFGFGAGGLVGIDDADGLFGWFGAAGTAGLVNLKSGLRHNLMTQYMPSGAYPVYTDFPVLAATDAATQTIFR
ncbi:serine hydrolase domain-containing protein [Alteraurantiacibacter aestuarii]|uniref:serine hydrolase domain-containing protein n=1 Tax=Alteraurantiacibacter aestuarii TaxID=650004 RepID=UPI00301E5E87